MVNSRIRTPFYIFFSNPVYANFAALSVRSLRSKIHTHSCLCFVKPLNPKLADKSFSNAISNPTRTNFSLPPYFRSTIIQASLLSIRQVHRGDHWGHADSHYICWGPYSREYCVSQNIVSVRPLRWSLSVGHGLDHDILW